MKWKSLSIWAKIGIIIGIIVGAILIISIVTSAIFFLINGPDHSALLGNSSIVIDNFYKNLDNRNYDSIFDILDKEWYSAQSKEKTVGFFNEINNNLGKVENYSLIGWNFFDLDIRYGNESEKGVRSDITLSYSVTRTNGSSTETFVLRKFEKDDKYFLRSYHIESKSSKGASSEYKVLINESNSIRKDTPDGTHVVAYNFTVDANSQIKIDFESDNPISLVMLVSKSEYNKFASGKYNYIWRDIDSVDAHLVDEPLKPDTYYIIVAESQRDVNYDLTVALKEEG